MCQDQTLTKDPKQHAMGGGAANNAQRKELQRKCKIHSLQPSGRLLCCHQTQLRGRPQNLQITIVNKTKKRPGAKLESGGDNAPMQGGNRGRACLHLGVADVQLRLWANEAFCGDLKAGPRCEDLQRHRNSMEREAGAVREGLGGEVVVTPL